MRQLLKSAFRSHIADSAVATTILLRVITAVLSVALLPILLINLSLIQQGYWYAFSSILAIAGYAEMGIGQVLMRAAARNWAVITQPGQEMVIEAVNRQAALFKQSLRYSCYLAIVVGVISFAIGITLLAKKGGLPMGTWLPAWSLAALVAPTAIFVAIANALFEGCQEIAKANGRRIVQALTQSTVTMVALATGGALISYGVGRLVASAVSIGLIWKDHRHMLVDLFSRRTTTSTFSWKREILSLQVRYGFTWLTNILTISIYVPVIFAVVGPSAAGKFGLTASLMGIAASYTSSWYSGRQAILSKLAGGRNHNSFISLATSTGKITLVLLPISYGALLIGYEILAKFYPAIVIRFIDFKGLIALVLSSSLTVMAGYVCAVARSFNEEPFVSVGIIQATIIACIIYPLVKLYGADGAAYTALFSYVAIVPLYIAIFKRYMGKGRFA